MENIGSLAENARIRRRHPINVLSSLLGRISFGEHIFRLFDEKYSFEIINSNGSDATTVYSIRYILACIRSGWYPHSIIRAIVGIKEASNQI